MRSHDSPVDAEKTLGGAIGRDPPTVGLTASISPEDIRVPTQFASQSNLVLMMEKKHMILKSL